MATGSAIHITRDAFAAENHYAGGLFIDIITQPGIGPLRTGIFNVADMAIMAGVVLWAFSDKLWTKKSG